MTVVLFRVDERLIHGQVVVAWGRRYGPGRIVVVDDELAGEALEQEIYRTGLPDDLAAEFWREEEAIERLPAVMDSEAETVFVLTADLDTMWRLAVGGVPIAEVNVGGLHAAAGRRRALSYVFLSPADDARIRDLEAAGVRVVARDVPTSPPVRLHETA